jgi:hypothetical protein
MGKEITLPLTLEQLKEIKRSETEYASRNDALLCKKYRSDARQTLHLISYIEILQERLANLKRDFNENHF